MALQLGDPASIYNTPGINTGNRFNAKDIDLPNIDDSQELYNIEPKRDLIANVQKILTK